MKQSQVSYLQYLILSRNVYDLFSMSETYQPYAFEESIHPINEIQSLKRVFHQIKFFHINL